VTQEFNLSVTPVGNNQYLVRTERVPFGAPLAQELVTWPVETWLMQARHLMSDPLQGVLQSTPPPTEAGFSRSSLNLIQLGQELYVALFQETLRDSWVIAQGVAQNRRESLRLRLGLKGPDLPRLPWEVMHGTDVPVERLKQPGSITPAPRPLATGTRIIFSRYQLGTHLVDENLLLPQHNHSLRILMVVSAPTDQEQLRLYREVKQMEQELQLHPRSESNGEATPEIQLKILSQPGREQLTRELEQGHYQVLHYAGHSDLGASGGSLYLVNSRTGLTEVLTGDDLAGLLVNNGIRLAVFNSCRGAHTAADPNNGRDRNLAEALVSRGIPAVLAMAEQIPDNVALNLTGLFYRNLKLGFPIDLSLNRARQGLISAYGSNQFYWALPVLYLHPECNGRLLATESGRETLVDRLNMMPSSYGVPISQEPLLPREPLRELEQVRSSEEWNPARPIPAREGLEMLDQPERATQPGISETVQQLTTQTEPTVQPIEPAQPSRPSLPLQAGEAVPMTPTKALKSTRGVGKRLNRLLFLPAVGAAGVALAFAGLHLLPQQTWQLPVWLGGPSADSVNTPPTVIDPAQTSEELRAGAKDFFEKRQIDQGIEAVKVLLNRNALQEASAAITAVPADFQNDPRINFLRGRLAWQGLKTKDSEHTVAQARDFWQRAAKDEPNNLDYQEALGFTYYADGDLETALKIWSDANSNLMSDDKMTLRFKAAIAVALKQDAAKRPADQQAAYLQTALQNYQNVVSRDRVINRNQEKFSLDALRQNWLWTDAAIKDWQALKEAAENQGKPPPPSPRQSPVASPSPSPAISP
jgi:tetratricopeptide (TPR) repeat protein